MCTFAPAIRNKIGALVQLVRMPACHAGGREFESRQHRKSLSKSERLLFLQHIKLHVSGFSPERRWSCKKVSSSRCLVVSLSYLNTLLKVFINEIMKLVFLV